MVVISNDISIQVMTHNAEGFWDSDRSSEDLQKIAHGYLNGLESHDFVIINFQEIVDLTLSFEENANKDSCDPTIRRICTVSDLEIFKDINIVMSDNREKFEGLRQKIIGAFKHDTRDCTFLFYHSLVTVVCHLKKLQSEKARKLHADDFMKVLSEPYKFNRLPNDRSTELGTKQSETLSGLKLTIRPVSYCFWNGKDDVTRYDCGKHGQKGYIYIEIIVDNRIKIYSANLHLNSHDALTRKIELKDVIDAYNSVVEHTRDDNGSLESLLVLSGDFNSRPTKIDERSRNETGMLRYKPVIEKESTQKDLINIILNEDELRTSLLIRKSDLYEAPIDFLPSYKLNPPFGIGKAYYSSLSSKSYQLFGYNQLKDIAYTDRIFIRKNELTISDADIIDYRLLNPDHIISDHHAVTATITISKKVKLLNASLDAEQVQSSEYREFETIL